MSMMMAKRSSPKLLMSVTHLKVWMRLNSVGVLRQEFQTVLKRAEDARTAAQTGYEVTKLIVETKAELSKNEDQQTQTNDKFIAQADIKKQSKYLRSLSKISYRSRMKSNRKI